MYKVIMTSTAKDDLLRCTKYIKEEIKNISASKKLLDNTEKTLASL